MTATITLHSSPPSAHLVWEAADLPAGTHTITVTRTADGLSYVVRGASALFADGGAVLDDYEIPVGVVVSYVAEAFDSDGISLGAVAALTGTIAAPDPKIVWISDPTNPNLTVSATAEMGFSAGLSRKRAVQTYQVGDRVVALLGPIGKLAGVPLRLVSLTAASTASLDVLLRQTAVLIRTAPPMRLPRLLYVVVPTMTENPLGWDGESSLWDLSGDEIDATTLDILIPVVTWQDYIDAFPTWADMEAAYSTWFDAMKNPPV